MRWWGLVGLVGTLGCRESLTPELPPDPGAPAAWNRLLSSAVDAEGFVRYDRIADNREVLDAYVAWVATARSSNQFGTPQAHAYWINVFNALVIHQVIARDLPGSVRDVPGWLPWDGAGFFFHTGYTVRGNEHLSLWEIANEKVLMATEDFRTLAALCTGTRSSPPMKPGLFVGEGLSVQLNQRFRAWAMDGDRLVRFDGDEVRFNPVLSWYVDELDLWTHGDDLCTIVGRHTAGEKRDRLKAAAEAGCPHGYFEPDWRLNDHFRVWGWRHYAQRRENRP